MARRRSAMDRGARQARPRPTPTAPPRSEMPAVAPPAPLPGHGDKPDAQTTGHGLTRVLSFRRPSGRRDQMTAFIGRRQFLTLLSGAAAGCPLAARTAAWDAGCGILDSYTAESTSIFRTAERRASETT